MTPLRGLKGCCHLLFCGNRIDFYFALSGLDLVCNLSTGLHPVLIYHTPSGLERLLPFVVLWQRNRFLFRPFRAGFWLSVIPMALTCTDILKPFRGWKVVGNLWFVATGLSLNWLLEGWNF